MLRFGDPAASPVCLGSRSGPSTEVSGSANGLRFLDLIFSLFKCSHVQSSDFLSLIVIPSVVVFFEWVFGY